MSDLLSDIAPPDLREQIAELRRELAKRAHVYANLIATGKLKPHRAAYQIRCLEETVRLLERELEPST